MRVSRFMSNIALTTAVVAGAALAGTATPTFANSITIVSDGSTLAAATSTTYFDTTSNTSDTTGLTFTPALVGAYGTFTSVPPGAPAGADVINIPPGDEYGFFKVNFTLPNGATNVSISGAANVDDQGYIFINGNQIGYTTETANATFNSNIALNFVVGVNEFLVSDINSGGGPSGAAFFATVTYDVSQTPLPAALPLFATGLGALGLLGWRRKRKAAAIVA
jgi:hypothetical protein